MLKKSIYLIMCLTLISSQAAFAFQPKEIASYFNGPTVSSVEDMSARVSLSQAVLQGLTDEEKQGVYFQYYETQQVCIMIYPTPEYCLPKKTEVGKSDVTISALKPNTSYTVVYKRDNTIRCITTPCPENGFESLSAEFTTKGDVIVNNQITKNLRKGSRGDQVIILQNILIQEGYLKYGVTGYFGVMTLQAVKQFQRDHFIIPTGFVGTLTRAALTGLPASWPVTPLEEMFEGTVTAYSTACFSDAVCSITVDGKKIVTTIGRSQEILGKVLGISDFGEIENNVGSHAKVYAKKTKDGYTLYGSSNYYIKIDSKRKLVVGSVPAGSVSDVQGATWVWQKTVTDGVSTVIPNKTGAFTVSFKTDGTVTGKTDCNGFFGSSTFGSDGIVQIGPFGSTMMFCENSQEVVFTTSLQKVTRYALDTMGNLTLQTGTSTMYFVKK